MPQKYIERILRAQVYDVARETPLDQAIRLSQRLNNRVWLKREDLQPVFSFKLRGAYNRMRGLSEDDRGRGVIAASAGNHARGVALSAKKLGIKAQIVMPKTTPPIKVQAVRSHGANAVLFGDSYDEAYEHALQLSEEKGFTFIHPFDDEDVIAGQGTVGMEILRQHAGPPDAIFVPVGGGGLIAGIGAYVKFVYPDVKVIGVEPEDANDTQLSLAAGERRKVPPPRTIADGLRVRTPGAWTWTVLKKLLSRGELVSDAEMLDAMRFALRELRLVLEPSGAASLALALREGQGRCGVLLSGGNVDDTLLAQAAATPRDGRD